MDDKLSGDEIDVSVIIVNWNTRKLLIDTIGSVIKGTLICRIEIIVVDNGSADDSVFRVREMYPAVTIIENAENLGFSKANNIGIKESRGKYICLVNSDILMVESCIDILYSHMESHNHIAMIGPKILNRELKINNSCQYDATLWNSFCQASGLHKLFPGSKHFHGRVMTGFDHQSERFVDVLSGCFLMVRKTTIEKVGVLDERFFIYAEDRDLCKRFRMNNSSILYYPHAETVHLEGRSSSKAPFRFSRYEILADFKFWDKYRSGLSIVILAFIKLLHIQIRIIPNAMKFMRNPGNPSLLLFIKQFMGIQAYIVRCGLKKWK